MEFRIISSLESNAAFKIAVCLCCHADIRGIYDDDFQIGVMSTLESLPLPYLLKRRIINYIGPLRNYLEKWLSTKTWEKKMPFRKINIGKFLCWTSTKTIDDRRTAKKILNSGILDITTAFRLACITCLEDDIAKLWSQVHPYFLCQPSDVLIKDFKFQEEVLFWIYYFSNKMEDWIPCLAEVRNSTLKAFNYGFQCGLKNANREFSLYFAQKCNLSKDIPLVIKCTEYILGMYSVQHPDLLLLLLSYLDDDKITELFQQYAESFLHIFQCWPLTPFFLDVAEHVYRYLNEEVFFSVIRGLASSLRKYVYNNMLEHVFTEFWNRSPDALRNNISEWIYDEYLDELIAYAPACVDVSAKTSNALEQLLDVMRCNGLIILDILNGPCCLNMLKTVINKYIPLTPAVMEFLNVISNQKSEHVMGKCEKYVCENFTSSMDYWTTTTGFPDTLYYCTQGDSESLFGSDFDDDDFPFVFIPMGE